MQRTKEKKKIILSIEQEIEPETNWAKQIESGRVGEREQERSWQQHTARRQ